MDDVRKPLLLIVDDDPLITDGLRFALDDAFDVITSHSRADAIEMLRHTERLPNAALIDLGLPPLPHRPDEGFALISQLLALSPTIRIVVLSGQSEEASARHARTLGAVDFAAKPCNPGSLQRLLERALAFRDDAPHTGAESSPLIGKSPAMAKLRVQIIQYADAPFPVLIEGESGSGKEVVARSCLSLDSRRRTALFSRSTARRFRPRWSSRPCSATPAAHSPVPTPPRRDISRKRWTARCFSTKSANCLWNCKPSCCGYSRTASISASAKP